MANQLIDFEFKSTEVRTFVDEQNELWFCAKDVCTVLGYRNDTQAIQKHCNSKGVSKKDLNTTKGIHSLTFINEPNLYRLIIKSRKPEAEEFESWVMEEVLPQIRKQGVYADTEQKLTRLTPEEIHANLLALGKEMQKKFPHLEISDSNVYIAKPKDYERKGALDPLQYWYAMERRGLPVVSIGNISSGFAIYFSWETWYEHYDLQTKLALFEELKKVCSGLRSYNVVRKFAFHELGESQRYEEVKGLRNIEHTKEIATAMQEAIHQFFNQPTGDN